MFCSLSSLFFFPNSALSDYCKGENCASECTGNYCGRTLPGPPLLRYANLLALSMLLAFHFRALMTTFYVLFPLLPFLSTQYCLFRVLHRKELRQQVLRALLRRYVTRLSNYYPYHPCFATQAASVCLLALSGHLLFILTH